jgi:hypothetical protein
MRSLLGQGSERRSLEVEKIRSLEEEAQRIGQSAKGRER